MCAHLDPPVTHLPPTWAPKRTRWHCQSRSGMEWHDHGCCATNDNEMRMPLGSVHRTDRWMDGAMAMALAGSFRWRRLISFILNKTGSSVFSLSTCVNTFQDGFKLKGRVICSSEGLFLFWFPFIFLLASNGLCLDNCQWSRGPGIGGNCLRLTSATFRESEKKFSRTDFQKYPIAKPDMQLMFLNCTLFVAS